MSKMIKKSRLLEYLDYEVWSNGDIYRVFKEGKQVKPIGVRICLNSVGRAIVNIRDNAGNRCTPQVSRLVAIYFVPNPENKPEVNHEDGDILNNWDWNLTWMIHAENMEHALKMGLMPKGEKHPSSKLNEDDVRYIRKSKESTRELVKRFGINKDRIQKVRKYKLWTHVKDE